MTAPTVDEQENYVKETTTSTSITEVVRLSKYEVLEKIAKCESGGTQFKSDGTVVKGIVNPQDIGKFQINEKYHLETAQSMGLDIYTLEGNTAYAEYLYETQGVKPWIHSAPCHGYY